MSTDLLSRIPEWEREAEVFEQKARALRQMADAVRVLNGDAARLFGEETVAGVRTNQYPTDRGPRGREAVRRITSERPGKWLVKDIKRINREFGWPSSDDSIVTAVVRMAAAGEATKIPGRKGLYEFGITRTEVRSPVTGATSEGRATGIPESP